MTLDCASVREQLAELDDAGGHGATAAAEIAGHLAGCAACRDVQRSLEEIDRGLASLGAIEPAGAVVDRTLARVEALGPAAGSPDAAGRVGLLAILGSVLGGVRRGLGGILVLLVAPFTALWRALAPASTTREGRAPRRLSLGRVMAAVGAVTVVAVSAISASTVLMSRSARDQVAASGESPGWLSEDGVRDRQRTLAERPPEHANAEHNALEQPSVPDEDEASRRYAIRGPGDMAAAVDRRITLASASAANDATLAQRDQGTFWVDGDGRRGESRGWSQAFEAGVVVPTNAPVGGPGPARAPNPFAERGRTEGLTFQEPRGYWANTYVPGDPALRSVYGRLVAARGQTLGRERLSGLVLAERVARTAQPFDPPTRAALGLYVHADRAAIDGAGRVLLQVGLRASDRASGHRPALAVVVVLDLRQPLSAERWARVQALLEAASRAREPDDRFGVVAAGPHGGTVIAQGTLRYGEIAVAVQRLRAGVGAEAPVPLEDAVRSAMTSLATPGATTSGTGLVWIVTPGLGAADPGLERVAHIGAVAGIVTSVLELGDAGGASALESVVLAGQGRRRTISAAADAERVVRAELEAGGGIVARAVRLRIRLAAGVRLVDILGSRRLDDEAAARVREAERAADLQLARELGITQDRGKDEDGVQIVVPTFYVGDSHVVLLDLVVAGPGPVADVSARYKDLVRMRNATASESFSLDRGARPRGALERNVVASFVAEELARVLAQASDLAAAGALREAAALLRAFATNVRALDAQYPELASDARIAADVELALGFASVLEDPSASGAAPVVADTLRYASYRRLLRPAL